MGAHALAGPSGAVVAEWEQDWTFHHPDGKARPARVPANRPHHPLALTDLSAERDLLDVVLSRTDTLLKDLARLPGCRDLSGERAAWQALADEAGKVPRSDMAARRALYLRACHLRRQVALTNPLLDFKGILFAKTAMPQLSFYSLAGQGPSAIVPGSGIQSLSGWRTESPQVRDMLTGRSATNETARRAEIAERAANASGARAKEGSAIRGR
jgi:hypothetical protein